MGCDGSEEAKAPSVATAANPLRLGATIPNFDLETTTGSFKFHEFLTGDEAKLWTVFFSHPGDYTPVCTTELGRCHSQADVFAKLGAKLIGISCDTVEVLTNALLTLCLLTSTYDTLAATHRLDQGYPREGEVRRCGAELPDCRERSGGLARAGAGPC